MSATATAPAIEQHTIHPIGLHERHGTPLYLFTIWFGSNIMVLTIVTGALATTLFKLPFVPAVFALVIGNLVGTIFMALHAAQGPRLGVPQMVQTRGQFGSLGSVVVVAIVVLMYAGYLASNMVLGGQSLHAVFPAIGINPGIVAISVVSVIAAIFGYDFLHNYSKYLSVASGLALILCFVWMIGVTGLPHGFLAKGAYSNANFLGAVSVAALWQLSYAPYVSDYTRYMPAETGAVPAFWATYWGTVLGSTFPMILGAMIGVVVGNGDVVAGLATATGSVAWLVIAIFTITITCSNAINIYCGVLAALTLVQTFIGNWHPRVTARIGFSLAFFVVGMAIAIIGQANFLTNYMNFIFLLLYVLVPWTAINLVDYYLIHHGDYDVASFLRADGGIYGRFNIPALVCYFLGILIEVPFMSQALYTGPIAARLGGADISWIVGLIVVSPLYYFASRNRARGVAVPATV